MSNQDYIDERAFYDLLDEKYSHCNVSGTVRKRSNNRIVKGDKLRAQIRGQRRHIALTKFVYWLYDDEISDRPVKPIDGDYRNLRFNNLAPYRTTAERFEDQKKLWFEYCHSSPEEQEEWLLTKPKPSPPIWGA